MWNIEHDGCVTVDGLIQGFHLYIAGRGGVPLLHIMVPSWWRWCVVCIVIWKLISWHSRLREIQNVMYIFHHLHMHTTYKYHIYFKLIVKTAHFRSTYWYSNGVLAFSNFWQLKWHMPMCIWCIVEFILWPVVGVVVRDFHTLTSSGGTIWLLHCNLVKQALKLWFLSTVKSQYMASQYSETFYIMQ